MHYLYFVMLPKETKLKEARETARDTLVNNNFANSDGGYFGSSKADWFEIGGRWSGVLTQINGKTIGKRDAYLGLGYKDDAIVLTYEMIEKIKAKYPDKLEPIEIFDPEEFNEITIHDLTEKDVGKVLVVVDYHN